MQIHIPWKHKFILMSSHYHKDHNFCHTCYAPLTSSPSPPTTTHTQPTTHTHIRGGWHTDFGADPVLIGVGIPLVCTIFCEPVVVFLPNFHGYIFVIKQRNKILASLPLFIRSQLQKTENSLWRGTSVFSENSYWLHIGFSKWKK